MSYVIFGNVDPLFIAGETEELEAANGSLFVAFYANVMLGLRLGNFTIRWPAKVGFTEQRDEPVLGQSSFIEHFRVQFSWKKKEIVVEGRQQASSWG